MPSVPRVAVVTDSTAHIPEPLRDRAGVTVVSVHVVLDGKSYREGVDIGIDRVAEALREGRTVTTSRPSPAEFAKVYADLAVAGHREIVSVHLSGALSGTIEAARLAAANAPVPVHIVDSRTVAMAAGFAALDAAEAVRSGADGIAAAEVARSTASSARLVFLLDTLEYLQRGGRIGAASRYFGQAFRVKPLLTVDDGQVQGLEKVRTSSRAQRRLAEIASETVAGRPGWRLALHQFDAIDAAEQLRVRLASEGLPEPIECELGAVLGVHTGPGAVALAIAPPAVAG